MSLRFDLTKIDDFRERCYEAAKNEDGTPILGNDGKQLYKIRQLTEYLINVTMYVGMNEISKKNAQEFYNRVSLYERVFNSELLPPRRCCTSAGEIKLHIGLSTNAPRMTKAQFIRHVWDCYERETRNVSSAEPPSVI